MKQQKKESDISIANLLAIAALVALGVLSFIGYSLKSGGKSIGVDILIAAFMTLGTALLLFVLIKIKTAKNDLKNFKRAEYIVLAVYIAYALGIGFVYPYHYFVVRKNSQNIISAAKQDKEQLDKWFEDYENAIKTTITELYTVIKSHERKDNRSKSDKLIEFYKNKDTNVQLCMAKMGVLKLNEDSLLYNSYTKKYVTAKTSIQKEGKSFQNTVEQWSVFGLSKQSDIIIELVDKTNKLLAETQSQGDGVPEIFYNESIEKYDIRNIKPYDCSKVNASVLRFPTEFKSKNVFSIGGLFAILLIHILILFNYFVVPRTSVVINKTQSEDGGIIL